MKKNGLLIILLASLAVFSFGQTSELNLLNNRRLAIAAFAKGDYQEAIKYFTEVIKEKPEHVAYRLRSISFGKMKNYKNESADFYEAWKYRFLRMQLDEFEPRKEYGLFDECQQIYAKEIPIAFKLSDEKTIAYFDNIIKGYPQNADSYVVRGWLHHFNGSADLAIEDFSRAIVLRPDDLFAHYARGRAYRKRGSNAEDVKKAIADFSVYLSRKPDDIHVLEWRAATFREARDFQSAVSDYDKLIKQAPKNSEYYYLRGSCYQELKNIEKAKKDFETVLNISPNSIYKTTIDKFLSEN